MSSGRARLIINCGARPTGQEAWALSQRATAAHSTITLADRNAAELKAHGFGKRRPTLTVTRHDSPEGTLIDGEHDGYFTILGVRHRRLLFVDENGGDIRGEDRLIGATGVSFCLRFHLHPNVQALTAQDGRSLWLRPSDGSGWRMRLGAEGLHWDLEEGIYLADPGRPRRAQQVTVRGTTGSGPTGTVAGPTGANGAGTYVAQGDGATTVIKWSLQREDAR
jgi:uncharacterized heparinase superfamily protein